MEIFLFELKEVSSLSELLLNGYSRNENIARKERIKIISILDHISDSLSNFSYPYVKEIDKFFDGSSLYEIKIQFSGNLIRIFCSCDNNRIVLYNFLVKPFFYEKQIKNKVNIDYLEKIEKAKFLYLSFCSNDGTLIKYKRL